MGGTSYYISCQTLANPLATHVVTSRPEISGVSEWYRPLFYRQPWGELYPNCFLAESNARNAGPVSYDVLDADGSTLMEGSYATGRQGLDAIATFALHNLLVEERAQWKYKTWQHDPQRPVRIRRTSAEPLPEPGPAERVGVLLLDDGFPGAREGLQKGLEVFADPNMGVWATCEMGLVLDKYEGVEHTYEVDGYETGLFVTEERSVLRIYSSALGKPPPTFLMSWKSLLFTIAMAKNSDGSLVASSDSPAVQVTLRDESGEPIIELAMRKPVTVGWRTRRSNTQNIGMLGHLARSAT